MKTTAAMISGDIPYGFTFGPATVNRLYSDRTGVGIEVETKRESLTVRVTKDGKIVASNIVRKNVCLRAKARRMKEGR